MPDDGSDLGQQYYPFDGDPSVSRRRLLQAAAFGTAGVAAGATSVPVLADEAGHDHSGDRLGEREPVESLTVDSVSIRDFDASSTYIVYEDEGTWYGLRTATQDVEFASADGVEVINAAVESGTVRVTAPPGGVVLESSTTMDVGGREDSYYGALIIEEGVTFSYTGSDQAVDLSGAVFFTFDVIEANGADYCIRDIGTGPGYVSGTRLRGAADSLWLTDGPNREIGAGTVVDIRDLDCTARPTPNGFKMTSGAAVEGFIVDIGAIRGPTENGVVLGTGGLSVKFCLVNAYIDGATNDAERLAVINDDHNGIWLRGYTPATGGDWDVEVHGAETYSTINAVTRRNDLRVLRDALETADLARLDEISDEVRTFDLTPDGLGSYQRELAGSGEVTLDAGKVIQHTGSDLDSWANLRKRAPHARLSFDDPAAIKTSVIALDNAGQEAWLVWGDRDGPAIGWRIVDDVLEGYVHDGDEASTVPLREGFNPGDSWILTAFHNPPTRATFYLEEVQDREVVSVDAADAANVTVTLTRSELLPRGLWPHNKEGPNLGSLQNPERVSTNLPSGTAEADRILTIDLTNTVPDPKTVLWSNWKHHVYPSGDSP